jgi:hypothetical protein
MDILAQRLMAVSFSQTCDYKVLGYDALRGGVDFDMVYRRVKREESYNDETRVMATREVITDKLITFGVYSNYLKMPSYSTTRHIHAVLKQARYLDSEYQIAPFDADLVKFTREVTQLDGVQQGRIVLDNVHIEPKLHGVYSATTVDNRVNMQFIEENRARIKSIKLAWFDEGVKISVDASNNGRLSVSCGDEDSLADVAEEQGAKYLSCCVSCTGAE